jgi:immunoglobulin-like protein involved in spore germination
MSTRKLLLPLLALILAGTACRFIQRNVQTPIPPVPVNPTSAATETPSPDLPLLSPEMLRNAEVLLPASNTKGRLVDGNYKNGSVNAFLEDVIAQGDVNNDGLDDLVFIIAENTGGSGTFISLEIAENNFGEPLVVDAEMLGDRVAVNSITIQNGLITLDMRIHGPNDGLCCPSMPATMVYTETDMGLILVRQTTKTPTGTERAITITAPISGESVTSAIHVTGSFTISPFENTLAYTVYDETEIPLLTDSTTVTAPDLGGPGTFDFTLNLPADVHGRIRIEIKDVSAADGSTLALDSVEVTVK